MEISVIYFCFNVIYFCFLPIIYFNYTKLFWICQVILIAFGDLSIRQLVGQVGRRALRALLPCARPQFKRTPFQRPRSFYFYFTSSNDTLGSLSSALIKLSFTYYQLSSVDRSEIVLTSRRIGLTSIPRSYGSTSQPEPQSVLNFENRLDSVFSVLFRRRVRR